MFSKILILTRIRPRNSQGRKEQERSGVPIVIKRQVLGIQKAKNDLHFKILRSQSIIRKVDKAHT